MDDIEELENYLLSNGITEKELVLCGNYIKIYVRELCLEYNIQFTNEELNESCKNLSYSLMKVLINFEESTNLNVEKQIKDIINDFQAVDKTSIGNLLFILNNAKENPETNTKLITELYSKFLPKHFDLSEIPDELK